MFKPARFGPERDRQVASATQRFHVTRFGLRSSAQVLVDIAEVTDAVSEL
jgi:hypothetical protein